MNGGANLISFWALPDDVTIANVMGSLGTNATGVIGQGVAVSQIGPNMWVGSLSSISRTSGYWVKLDNSGLLSLTEATPTESTTIFDLNSGANLISFPYEGSSSITDAIPDAAEAEFLSLIHI